jgi:serine O-acetyltransferase
MELIDVPTCNPFGTVDCWGSSGLSEPSLLRSIKEDLDCVRQRDPAARSKLETLLTFAHRLWSGGWRFLARFLSWLVRFLSDVNIHHWQAHLH